MYDCIDERLLCETIKKIIPQPEKKNDLAKYKPKPSKQNMYGILESNPYSFLGDRAISNFPIRLSFLTENELSVVFIR